MKIKKQILLLFLIISFPFILTSTAHAAPDWLRRVEITITPQIPESYQGTEKEFRANPTYLQGEQAVFNITFNYVIRIWTFRIKFPVDVPERYIRATFPNPTRQVSLTHILWGLYNYTSPILTDVGERNHTLTVTIAYTIRFRILGRTYTIPIILTQAQSSISVNQRPLDIQITSPPNSAILNTNPLPISGTIDDNNAEVIVNSIPATVSDNRFSAEVPVVEGENTITAHAENEFGTTDIDTITVTIDTVLPVVEITYPEEGLSTGESEITISGTYTEANMGVITVNGIETTFGEGLFSASGIPLSIIGDNTITVVATDRAGNTSEDSIVIERILTTEGILESLYNHFNLVNDMTADMVVTSTFDSQPFGPPVYARYYYKKINKTKTEFYDTAERENITEIVITDNGMEYFISPVTRYISQDNLAERAGISQEQFRNMDITSNVEGFIENHTLTQIETEANPTEGIYVIEAAPNMPNQLYSKLKLWMDVNKGLLMKSELYRGGNLIETTETLETLEVSPGIWTETRMRKTPQLESGEFITTVEYNNIRINQGLTDAVFDPENQL